MRLYKPVWKFVWMLTATSRKLNSFRSAVLPLWRSLSEDPSKGFAGKDGVPKNEAPNSQEPASGGLPPFPNVQSDNEARVPQVPSDAVQHAGTDSMEPQYGLGSATHIAAPQAERPASGEGGLVTFLGSVGEGTKTEEVITFLGERPQEGTEEAAELEPTFEVAIADEIPDRNLPFVIHIKQKRKPVTSPIDALQAVQEVQKHAKSKFEETLEVHMKLLADPRRGDQLVRGAAVLPHGTGKKMKIAVFADGHAAQLAKEAGADLVGGEDFIKDIQTSGGSVLSKIDKCIATPDMMRHLGKLGRILGPKGLMPNPKLGTLTNNVTEAIEQMRKGRVEFRADKTGVVHVGIGKVKFATDNLYQNLGVLASEIMKCRPKGLKGSGIAGYIDTVNLSSTMGPGIPVAPGSILTAIQGSKNTDK